MIRRLAALLLLGLAAGGAGAGDAVDAFLARHWQQPLAPQGAPPAAWPAREASLAPEDCAACHPQQHAQWRGSLHARTMGPGIAWQLALMTPDKGERCLRCHAPLAEQKALLARTLGWANAPASPPPAYVPPGLDRQGLVCAACHLRRHERFGPPRAAGAAAPLPPRPHGGFRAEAAFQDSRFCAGCHQFPADGPRTKGKLHEDTLAQWQASPAARDGRACQSCHMPARRHEWRGVHDPQMLRQGLAAELVLKRRADGGVDAVAMLRNAGAGHLLPTYMVPKIEATLVRVGAGGERVLARHVIGWQIDLALAEESFDTRLAPGAAATLAARLERAETRGGRVELRVAVAPREHYERMFRYVLAQRAKLDARTQQTLQAALDEAVATRYEALRLTRALPPATRP
ncbi:hypothetical protein CKO44_21055 [Rubrivivax gelatinosus]|uniref:Cytochrome c-552/4 domain-containing protein n=1 Tax=Rubrivivax gelatinosus TaxID=28068 RepID=A0ABS1DQL9_RUBGE|nr:hypothetical protein [Rubrivivax gelatinosus]MBK1711899.1 hypothetical protein [Rubrivivax gelatinosus]